MEARIAPAGRHFVRVVLGLVLIISMALLSSPLALAQSPEGAVASGNVGEIVKTYRNSLVLISNSMGAGSGFIANLGGTTCLITNAHVAAEARGATLKSLDGTTLKAGAPAAAVGHDIFRIQLSAAGQPFEVMEKVDENAAVGDEVVVLGNSEGAGVVKAIPGKIVGVGPNLVEVDAPFVPGNSGSPIVHLKTGKVIAIATYLLVKKFDPATHAVLKEPEVRRFGFRLDSVKTWQPVNWTQFFAQAAEVQHIEGLTKDLEAFLIDIAKNHHVTPGMHNNPVIRNRIDAWSSQATHRLSPADAAMNDQNFVSFLKSACQSDVIAARQRLTYDYFQRALENQQQVRNELTEVFDRIIKELRQQGR